MKKINRVDLSIEDRLIHVKFKDQEYSNNILYKTKLSFKSGKLYGIICNHNECGWGISYLLSGRVALDQEKIVINNKRYGKKDTIKEGWYVGEGLNQRKLVFLERTIKQQIALALKHSQLNMTVNEIVSKFDLSQDKINNKYSHMSWESWRVSVAIGYANKKIIFCFPWLDTAYLKDVISNTGFMFYIKILKDTGNIILLPTSDRFILENISDEIITINDPRFHNYNFIEEYIKQQKIIYK